MGNAPHIRDMITWQGASPPDVTMGDGTPVTLEGYWDGTQLLPAEFVGLATT